MSNFIVIAVSLIVAILISNFASQQLRSRFPNINGILILVIDVAIYVAVYLGGLNLYDCYSKPERIATAAEQNAKQIIADRGHQTILRTVKLSQSDTNVTYKVLTKELYAYECSSDVKKETVFTTCKVTFSPKG